MATSLPARNILDGTALPVTSQMKTALGSVRDYLADLLGTTGVPADARTALIAAKSGANADITSLTALTAGGLPDSSVTTPDIADAAITVVKLATESKPLGSGQTRQDMIASRAVGTTYTNSTGRTIKVIVSSLGNVSSVGDRWHAVIGGFTQKISQPPAVANAPLLLEFEVFSGETYSVTNGVGSVNLATWIEIR